MPGLKRFGKYALIGLSTFVFDMLLLVLAVSLGVPYYIAVGGAFLIAITINYTISRRFVFKGTSRPWDQGLAYFVSLAVGGAFLTTGGVVFLVEVFHFHYLVGRMIVGIIVSLAFYWINLKFNFRVAGLHL